MNLHIMTLIGITEMKLIHSLNISLNQLKIQCLRTKPAKVLFWLLSTQLEVISKTVSHSQNQ
jgi:hypothetical protein